MVLAKDVDLLDPPAQLEKRKKVIKRLVQSRNSCWMDVMCEYCFTLQTLARHSQNVFKCKKCKTVLCQPPPTGGLAKVTEACHVLPPRPWPINQ